MNYKELQQIAKDAGAVIDVLMLGRHDNTVFTNKRTVGRIISGESYV